MSRRWVATLVALLVFCAVGARAEEATARTAVEIRAATVPELIFTPAEARGHGFTLVIPSKASVASSLVGEAMRGMAPALIVEGPAARVRAVQRLFVRFSLVGIVELRL